MVTDHFRLIFIKIMKNNSFFLIVKERQKKTRTCSSYAGISRSSSQTFSDVIDTEFIKLFKKIKIKTKTKKTKFNSKPIKMHHLEMSMYIVLLLVKLVLR